MLSEEQLKALSPEKLVGLLIRTCVYCAGVVMDPSHLDDALDGPSIGDLDTGLEKRNQLEAEVLRRLNENKA
jgi:hypothetical protein